MPPHLLVRFISPDLNAALKAPRRYGNPLVRTQETGKHPQLSPMMRLNVNSTVLQPQSFYESPLNLQKVMKFIETKWNAINLTQRPEPGVCGFKHLRVRANALSILLVLPGFWMWCVAGENHLSRFHATHRHKASSVAFAPSPANDVNDMITPQTNTEPNGPKAFVCHLSEDLFSLSYSQVICICMAAPLV